MTIMIQPLLIQQFRKRISLTPQMQSCIKDCEESSWPREKTGASSASKLHLPLCLSKSIVTSVSGITPQTGKKPLGQTGVYVQ